MGVVRTLVTVLSIAMAAPVLGQSELEVERDAPFLHERTGIALPAQVGTAVRWRVTDFGDQQYDVGALDESPDSDVLISLYLYRAGLADVSVTADVVTRVIIQREEFAPRDAARPIAQPFSPPNNGLDSAMRLAYATRSDARYPTASVALVPHGP